MADLNPKPTTKRRNVGTSRLGRYYVYELDLEADPILIPANASSSGEIDLYKVANGTQVTVSESHPPWRRGRPSTHSRDIGGDFFSQRRYVETRDVPRQTLFAKKQVSPTLAVNTFWRGPCIGVNPVDVNWPPYINSSNAALDAAGATAISRCKPTNSVADLSVFLGETLRQGLPKLIGSTLWKDKARSGLNKTGSEYLNFEFGWKPVVRDIRSLAHAINHADAVMRQYRRDSGKSVRRRYEFPPEFKEESTMIDSTAQIYAPGAGSWMSDSLNLGRCIRVRQTTRRKWFSGAFTYYVPNEDNMYGLAAEARKLLGLSLTPGVVWNLAPWSWAVDWFVNAGDVIDNYSHWQADGLVMRYGYIMEHTMLRDTYYLTGGNGYKSRNVSPTPVSVVSETKIRRKANPFGFGLAWSGLTPTRLAIAAALGFTRS